MNEIKKDLTIEQASITAAFCQTYDLEKDDVIFFSDKPEPFFSYTATCVLCNHLANLQDIDIEEVHSVSDDSLTLKCNLVLGNGKSRSANGVVNRNDWIDGKPMTDSQIYELASARALRNALKAAGINLLTLHEREMSGDDVLEFQPKSYRNQLLGEAHALGQELGLIFKNNDGTENKRAWRGTLFGRYKTESSRDLTDDELTDFIAQLRSFSSAPQIKKAA